MIRNGECHHSLKNGSSTASTDWICLVEVSCGARVSSLPIPKSFIHPYYKTKVLVWRTTFGVVPCPRLPSKCTLLNGRNSIQEYYGNREGKITRNRTPADYSTRSQRSDCLTHHTKRMGLLPSMQVFLVLLQRGNRPRRNRSIQVSPQVQLQRGRSLSHAVRFRTPFYYRLTVRCTG